MTSADVLLYPYIFLLHQIGRNTETYRYRVQRVRDLRTLNPKWDVFMEHFPLSAQGILKKRIKRIRFSVLVWMKDTKK